LKENILQCRRGDDRKENYQSILQKSAACQDFQNKIKEGKNPQNPCEEERKG
jgi:hypothetical protein